MRVAYLHPYFFSGFMCYLERGDTLVIDNQEFFVNDCTPSCGIVDKETELEVEIGFSKSYFRKMHERADQ